MNICYVVQATQTTIIQTFTNNLQNKHKYLFKILFINKDYKSY